MIVKLTQDLNKGFAPWKEMVHNNAHKMKEHGFRAIFAGTEAGDDNKLHVIMEFDSPASLEAFKNDAELTQARIDAGAGGRRHDRSIEQESMMSEEKS